MKIKSITLSEVEIEQISTKSEKYGITFSDMIRRIVDKYFEEEKENGKTKENGNDGIS